MNFKVISLFIGLMVLSMSSWSQHEVAFSVGAVRSHVDALPDNYSQYLYESWPLSFYSHSGENLASSEEISNSATNEAGTGAEWSLEYGYYITSRIKPFLRLGRSSKNYAVTRFISGTNPWSSDFDIEVTDSYRMSSAFLQFGGGVAYELPVGLSFSLGWVGCQRRGATADVESSYSSDYWLGEDFEEATSFSSNVIHYRQWVPELGVRYRVGSIAIDVRRLGPIGDAAYNDAFSLIPYRHTYDFNLGDYYSISSLSVMLTYSKFFNP